MNRGRRPLVGAGVRNPDSAQGRWPTRLGGGDQAHRRRAGVSCGAAPGNDRLPFGKLWHRRQDGHRPRMRQADDTEGAVVHGAARILLRRLRPVVGAADRDAPGPAAPMAGGASEIVARRRIWHQTASSDAAKPIVGFSLWKETAFRSSTRRTGAHSICHRRTTNLAPCRRQATALPKNIRSRLSVSPIRQNPPRGRFKGQALDHD
jgi:hypothetical protein